MDDALELGEVEALVRTVGAGVGVTLASGNASWNSAMKLVGGPTTAHPRAGFCAGARCRGGVVKRSWTVRPWAPRAEMARSELTVRSARNFSNALTSTYAGPVRPDG